MPEPTHSAKVQVPWRRRQWLKITAWIEDHPRTSIASTLLLVGLAVFYATSLRGCAHLEESSKRWRLENFGGTHRVDRAVRTPDVVLSLKRYDYDRLDIVAPTASHLGGTAFRAELRKLAGRGGKIRIAALDPRLADSAHPNHQRFLALSQAYGMQLAELSARCWHSTAVLLHLREELGANVEIRMISTPDEDAAAEYFCIGRSGHSYFSEDPGRRLDVIVPRPPEPTFSDSFNHPGLIVKNRPDHPDVVRFTDAFTKTWAGATPVDPELAQELSSKFDAASDSRN